MSRSYRRHGGTGTVLYSIWKNIKKRCGNPNDPSYRYYGGRGISLCNEWLDFAEFRLDVGDRPTPKHTIDRINNNGDYCKENVRWSTRLEQRLNQRVVLNKSGFTGVQVVPGNKYQSRIGYQRISHHIGHFNTPEQAALARDKYIIQNRLPHKLSSLYVGLSK